MRKALEGPVALEELLSGVAHDTLHLALCPRAVGMAGLGQEAVVAGQLLKAFVEGHGAGCVRGHRSLVVVDPDLLGDATKPGEGASKLS